MKEHIKETLSSFVISAALINAAMFVLGIIFRPEQRFGYEVFVYPLIYAAISCVPQLIMYSDKELTLRQTIVRKIITLCMIVVVILISVLGGSSFDISVAVGIAASVVIIYIAVNLIQWYLDSRTAKQMMESLAEFRKKAADEYGQ